MDNMFDSLKWSNCWDSPMAGPQMMNNWDYVSTHTWTGIPQADEYFDIGYPADPMPPHFDLGMQPTSHPADMMNGHYGQMEQPHSLR